MKFFITGLRLLLAIRLEVLRPNIVHFITKGAILGLYASNPISSNSLRPILTNFRIFTILSLSATLTQFETSVGGGEEYLDPLVALRDTYA